MDFLYVKEQVKENNVLREIKVFGNISSKTMYFWKRMMSQTKELVVSLCLQYFSKVMWVGFLTIFFVGEV